LLDGSGDEGVGSRDLFALGDGADGPAGAAELEEKKCSDDVAGFSECGSSLDYQKSYAGQADQHSFNSRCVEFFAARSERFDADHPKRARADEERGQAAGNPLFGKSEAAVADAEDDDAASGGGPEFPSARKMGAGELGSNDHHEAGDGVAQGDERGGREGFERHPNAEVGGTPEYADTNQRDIRGKFWMIFAAQGTMLQGSGTMGARNENT
jgi:hypothetical protein